MPGGVLLATLYFIYGDIITPLLDVKLDIFYTFLFFCCAFIVGEVLQIISHELEFIIDLFFRCRRPSQVFLYKNNPVVNNEQIRLAIAKKLKLSVEDYPIVKTDYSDLPILFGRSKDDSSSSQGIFWKLYANVSNSDEIKIANRSYLFARVIMIDFLLICILLFTNKIFYMGIIGVVIFSLFLWRSRGIARGLVFKTVILNLKE